MRLPLIVAALAFLGCASDPNLRADLTEARGEIRALRDANRRLEDRVERLEARADLSRRPGHADAEPAKGSDANLPSLTVVKLRPRADVAPALNVDRPVVEPAPETVEALADAQTASDDGPPVDPAFAASRFDAGMSAIKTGDVEGGVAKLEQFAADYPKNAQADNALYFAGMGLMGLSDFEGASREFEQVLSKYPAGDAVVDAMLKLAECRSRLNRTSDARTLYTQVVNNYPGTAAANLAEQRLVSLLHQ